MSYAKPVKWRKLLWLLGGLSLALLLGLGAVSRFSLVSGPVKVITSQRMLSFEYPLLCIAISPNGKMIAAGGWASSIGFWNLESGQLIGKEEVGRTDIHSLAFSPTGTTLAVGANQVQLRNMRTGKSNALAGSAEALTVAFSPDGKFIGSVGDSGVQLWDTQKTQLLWEVARRNTQSVAFSSDSKSLATSAADGSITLQGTKTGQMLWQVPSSSPVRARVGVGIGIFPIAIAANGNILAQGTENGFIGLYSLKQGALLRSLSSSIFDSSSPISAVAFSPNGQILASGSYDQVIKLWAMPTGTLISKLQGLSSPVTGITFSPDGQTLVGTSTDGKVALWNLR